MKNLISYAALLSLGLTVAPNISFAQQNYVPPAAYGGPNVIVNMDVITTAPQGHYAPTPLTSRPAPRLRSPSEARAGVPIRLRAPVSMPKSAIAANPTYQPIPLNPIGSMQKRTAQAPIVLTPPQSRQQQIAESDLVPINPMSAPNPTTLTPQFARSAPAPQKPAFSAKELADAAQPMIATPVVPAPKAPTALVNEKIAATKSSITSKTNAAADRQRELLAKAREEIMYDDAKTAANETVETIQNIEPSAAKMMDDVKENAPTMPPVATLDPVVLPTPAISKPVEKPMEMAALTMPETPTMPTAPVELPAETVAKATTPAPQTLSLEGDDAFRLIFGQEAADLSQDDVAVLDQVAVRLKEKNGSKIQLRSFADGTPETTSKARRLSLTRALTVRSYLLDKGVSATAMDVRALGLNPTDANAPADRVDIVFVR